MNKKNSWLLILTLLTLLFLTACAAAEEAEKIVPDFEQAVKLMEGSMGVVLIPVEFRDDRWFLGEGGIQVLPCAPPSPFLIGEANGPRIQVLGRDNQVVYTASLPMDPRIILYEGPTENSNILKEVSIVLKLPLLPEMQALEFFIDPGVEGEVREQKPDLQVDLQGAIRNYEDEGGINQYAECQEPVYKPDALKK